MASDVTVRVRGTDPADGRRLVDEALGVFSDVEVACTRFDPESPLMRANAHPDRWHRVPPLLYRALGEAFRAHQRTGGRFDPRVLRDLVGLGYDRSLPFEAGPVEVPRCQAVARRAHGPWRPRFRGGPSLAVHLGGVPVDLGGIGKGLAVRWASERLAGRTAAHLIEAGGDCWAAGTGPDGPGWRVGVEDPLGGTEPLAVLELRDRACATSSVRVRAWRAGGRRVHHLVDPRTGLPGGDGLRAVTVVGRDPAEAEVWSKVLFLQGAAGIGEAARHHRVAAFWVDDDGAVGESPALSPFVLWRGR